MDLISREKAIIQLSHNKSGNDDSDVVIQHDIETVKGLPSAFEGMTNGEVIISLYPDLKYTIQNGRVVTTIGVASSFDWEWWNAPYKAESEVKHGRN
jgi:hypothetical protein